MTRTLAQVAADIEAARRLFMDALARATGLYRLIDWMLHWWEPRC
jgi:hypothetical protein